MKTNASSELIPKLIKWCYLATPLFALADLILDVNLRVPGFRSTPMLKWTYYAFLTGAGILIHYRPRLLYPLALGESFLNLLSLVFGVMLPFYKIANELLEGTASRAGNPFTREWFVAFLLSATIAVVSFYRNPLIGLKK